MADKKLKQLVMKEVTALESKAAPKAKSPPVLKALRSLRPNKLVMRGPVTGKRYEWPRVGYVRNDVDAADYSGLLKMSVATTTCCGGATTVKRYVVEA